MTLEKSTKAGLQRSGGSPPGTRSRAWRHWWSRNRKGVTPYLFIAPNILLFGVFLLFPIIFAIFISLTEWSLIGGSPEFVGIDNYVDMFTEATFWQVVYNTIVYTVATVPVTIALGLLIAMGLNRQMPGRVILRAMYFVPFVISMVAVALTGQWILNQNYGMVDNVLAAIGIGRIPWLTSPDWAMVSVILETYWIRVGFSMIVYLAALQGLPRELYEAAKIDGASTWQQFKNLTVPLLKPTTFLLVVLNVVYSLYVFDLIYVQTNGGPGQSTTVLVIHIYQEAFKEGNVGYASAVGVFLYVVLMLFTVVYWRVSRQSEGVG